MISKLSRALACCFMFAGVLRADDSFHDKIRDIDIETTILTKYVFNSNCVVEVDDENYPELDQMVADLSKKAGIKKPMTFLITRKFPVFFDKANACAVGDKEKSAIFVGSWFLGKAKTDELEGIVSHEIAHIVKDHPTKLSIKAFVLDLAVL